MQDSKYRPGVGAMIFNHEKKIFVAKRLGMSSGLQMPQGGIDAKEDIINALYRELEEEIGTTKFSVIRSSLFETKYDFPHNLGKEIYKGKYMGQSLKWFLLKFEGRDQEINIQTKKPEFIEWQWIPIEELVGNVVAFKKTTYKTIVNYFRPILRSIEI